MSKVFIDGDSVRNLSSEAFNALLLEYTNHLKSRGHSDRTVKSYLNSVTHFIQWLAQSSFSHMMITPEAVQVFLYQHLSVCSCPQPAPKRLKNVRAALNRLLLSRLTIIDLGQWGCWPVHYDAICIFSSLRAQSLPG
jgi:hypothetical protein